MSLKRCGWDGHFVCALQRHRSDQLVSEEGQYFCQLPGGSEPSGSIACCVVGAESIQGELKCFCLKDGTRRMRLLGWEGYLNQCFLAKWRIQRMGL